MKATETKENKKELKRRKIIESAFLLFSQKSYHEVMMEDVAKLSSIAKGTVYNYFNSKDELYYSIIKMRMEELTGSLKENITSSMNSVDALRAFVIHLYMFMMKHKRFFLIYKKESLNAEREECNAILDLENELKDILTEIILSGKQDGLFHEIEETFAVDLILGSIYGAVQRGIDNNFKDDIRLSEREQIFHFVLHGLFNDTQISESFPLKDKTIVITRTVEQSKESAEAFKQLGANVIVFPTLDIVPPDDWYEFDEIISNKNEIDFIIFTSAHAVKMFLRRCDELNTEVDFNRIKVVAVGNKTAAVCERLGVPVHIIPKKFSGEGVISELMNYDLDGKVIFIPRSAIGREELPTGLERLGAMIKAAPAYNVTLPSQEKVKENLFLLKANKPDLFIFTSPSTFRNFLEIVNVENPSDYFREYDVAAIGPTTKSAIEKMNVSVTLMPDEFTIDGLVKTILEYYKKSLSLTLSKGEGLRNKGNI